MKNLTRNIALLGLYLLVLFSCTSTLNQRNDKNEKPNILFIFTDQQTISAMSCSGNTYLETPVMDGLAAMGVRFENAYCTSPVCAPSRSSMLTSRMPHETGYDYNLSPREAAPSEKLINMGDIFREAGYKTMWAGKWHLNESYPLRSAAGKHPLKECLPLQGFDILPFYDSTKNWPEWGRGDTTDPFLADAVIDYINNYSDKQPFLLGVSFCNPHDVCYVPGNPGQFPSSDNMDELPPLPMNSGVDPNESELIQKKRLQTYYGGEITAARHFSDVDWQRYIYTYYRMTERVDQQIGRVIEALKKKGLEDNTLIIFTSDHGDGVGSHQWAAKLSLYEESVRVPFIISWKGQIPSGVVNSNYIVSGLDILPTMCDYAGIDIPETFLGRSLKPALENPDITGNKYVVTELAPDPKDTTNKGRMIRMEQYKYNLYSKGERNEQLYDLNLDPGEMQNLADDPALAEMKESLKSKLVQWMEETDDDFLDVWEER